MNIMDWMEPSIVKRLEYVTDRCDKEAEMIDIEYRTLLDSMARKCPEMRKEINDLSDLFFNRQSLVRAAYRIGLSDGLAIASHRGGIELKTS